MNWIKESSKRAKREDIKEIFKIVVGSLVMFGFLYLWGVLMLSFD